MEGKTQEIPITMTVSVDVQNLVSIDIDVLTPNINPGNRLRFNVELVNLGIPGNPNVTIVYIIKQSDTERKISETSENLTLEDSILITRFIEMGASLPTDQYYLEVWAYFGEGRSVNEIVMFNLVEPYWSSWEGRAILMVLSFIGMGIIGYYFLGALQEMGCREIQVHLSHGLQEAAQGGR